MPTNNNLQYTLSLKDLFSKNMANAIGQTEKLDSKMSGLGNGIKSLVAGVGVAYLGKEIFEAGTAMDSLNISLKTMLGSKEKADKLMGQMIKFASETPFQQDEVATAGKQLLAYGVSADNIIPSLKMLGDVSAGLNQPIGEIAYLFGTIKTQGKAMTVDIRQFANRGIPIYEELAKVTGKSGSELQKFIEDGKVGFPQIEQAFKNMSGQGGKFAGLMGELSKTTGGQWSNLKDQLIQLAVSIFKILQPAINALITGLKVLMGFINNNLGTIKTLATVILSVWVAMKLWNGITMLISAVTGVKFLISLVSMTAGLQGMTVAQYALNTAMELNPLGLVLGAVLLLVAALKDLYDKYQLIKGQFQAKENNLQSIYFKGQIDSVRALSKEYQGLGMSAEQANQKAISTQSSKIDKAMAGKFADLKSGKITKEAFDYASGVASKAKEGLKSVFNEKTSIAGGTNPSLSSVSSGTKTSKDSGTEISGSKPQNLTINITKLVESLNVNTTNLKESAQRIREEVAKALLETVNDVNLVAR